MKPILICIALLAFMSSCQKELGNQSDFIPTNNDQGSSSGTAVFSLNGAPGICDNHVIGGVYNVGSSLNAANAVAIQVMVDSPGTYNISTANIDGIKFSASGSFDAAGIKTIMLQGTGMPLNNGTFNFKPGANFCSFPLTIMPANTSTQAVGTLDCSLAWSEGSFPHGAYLTDSTKLFVPVNITGAGSYRVATAPINGVVFSAAGTFQTGNQTLVLTSHDKPTESGRFPLTVSLGSSVCSFDIYFQ